MSDETFAATLRAELDAVVGRYEAIVRALSAAAGRETEALRVEAARLAGENQRVRAEIAERAAELATLRGRVEQLERELAAARELAQRLEGEARAAKDTTLSYEEQFTTERGFVEAARDLGGSLLGDALAAIVGQPLEARSATFAALKARGLEAALVAAVKDRGRNAVAAPLLDRERAALVALAKAASCELVQPPHGARFAPAAMEKASTVSEPAEEGNVVDTAMPGLRRAGTEGALVFPRVVVATG